MGGVLIMKTVNLNNPIEIRAIGLEALKEALGPVGMVKFIQQYDPGYGDYTTEKYNEQDINLEEINSILKKYEKENIRRSRFAR